MTDNFFLKDKPRAVADLMNELRVLIDQRKPTQTGGVSGNNVINFSKAVKRQEDSGLLEKYQELIGPAKEYFFKTGKEVTYESFLEFMNELARLQESIKEEVSE